MKVLPYGAAALLVELDDPAAVLPLAHALRGATGVLELVPGARTLLVRSEPAMLTTVTARLQELGTSVGAQLVDPGDEIELEVRYDGADLVSTAAELAMAPDELVRRHAAGHYVVAFCGFAPGFGYLTGLDPELHVARLAHPRSRVPGGSVGIAGEFTGVYPRPSPGGWRLLGRTDARLWDSARTPPALLSPGTRVRFRPA